MTGGTGGTTVAAPGLPRVDAAFWARVPSQGNVGDRLTAWLVHRVTGRLPRYERPQPGAGVLLGAGSIIEYATEGSVVWGSGILSRRDRVDPRARLLAVRGPLTRQRAIECGGRGPDVMGDPGSLLATLLAPRVAAGTDIGVVANWCHRHEVATRFGGQAGLRVIDACQPVEPFVDAITACEVVVSSSLHGLVIAHAYGRPAVWVDFGGFRHGDGVKFVDYLSTVGMPHAAPIGVPGDRLPLAEIAAAARSPWTPVDTEALWATCPFLSDEPQASQREAKAR